MSALLQISEATVADVAEMVALLGQLYTQETEFTPDLVKQTAGLQMILAQPDTGRMFVARVNGRVIGMVSLLLSISTAEGGRVAWLEDMVVDSGCRAEGVGTLLIESALAWAKEQGLLRVSLLTDDENEIAQAFYEQHGFVESAMKVFRFFPGREKQ